VPRTPQEESVNSQTADQSNALADVSALAWLAGAGVDTLVDDAPRNWLAAPPVVAPPVAQRPPQAPRAMAPPPAAARRAPAAAVATAAGANTLAELVSALAALDHLLHRHDTPPQLFAGNMESGLLVISEQPEAPDSEAARLRARMLAAIGLGSEDHGIVHLVPWPTIDNGPPREAQLVDFSPFVARVLELAKPRLLLALGERAATLGGPVRGLASTRGAWRDANGVPILATYHPRTLLAQPDHKRHAWADLQSFAARISETST
jgi:uracil-DNA glycosylase family 4